MKVLFLFYGSHVGEDIKKDDILYPYSDETRDIRSNITLCLKEFPRAKPKGTPKAASRVES